MSGELLLDTNIVIALINETEDRLPRRLQAALVRQAGSLSVSVVSAWEISIKYGAGRLELRVPRDKLAQWFGQSGLVVLPMTLEHALEVAHPEPATKDPFDRLLLAVCVCEGMKLLTTDVALAGHRLVY
jgi:PIN domain nuclease of toxin-antitoxin system